MPLARVCRLPLYWVGGHVVGGVAFLAVAGLVQTQGERGHPQRLAQQRQPCGPQVRHRPRGLGQEVMQRLRVGVHRLAQPGQRLAPRLRQQAQVESGELLEVPDMVKQRANVGTVLVDAGHRWGGWSCPGRVLVVSWSWLNLLREAIACTLCARDDR
jgi:hypothetical protein